MDFSKEDRCIDTNREAKECGDNEKSGMSF